MLILCLCLKELDLRINQDEYIILQVFDVDNTIENTDVKL